MNIYDIDFGQLYREHMATAGRPKPAQAWDARADEMNRTMGESGYVDAFIGRMDFTACSSLLDVGCGTGAIALAAAPRLEQVIGLDYSPRMLELLAENARARGLDNVRPVRRAWEDDWSDIPACDIVVASRSTSVMDMADALARLDAKAKQRVYLTSLAGGRFVDPSLYAAIGRTPPPPLPDYIYILNILHGMGIHARLDYIENDNRLRGAEDFDAFAGKAASVLGELTPGERDGLKAWYGANPERAREGGAPFRWAFVSWNKTHPGRN
jgi:SAM-dependent methyltransferase